MKAKDTVIGIVELNELYRRFRTWHPLHEGLAVDKHGELLGHLEACYKVNEAQAKISFKAGMEYALTKEGVKESLDSICRRERQEGRREVVEELSHYSENITLAQLSATNRWQAFKKERGIK